MTVFRFVSLPNPFLQNGLGRIGNTKLGGHPKTPHTPLETGRTSTVRPVRLTLLFQAPPVSVSLDSE